jgi:iron complex transport system substrate-binding protein
VRIVSLLPSTTEILFAIGAGGDVVGVTFECDYPPEACSRRIVSTSALPSDLSAAEIDTAVSAALARGEDLYHLDRDALADLDPDVVVTQDLCAVCAVDVSVVDDALAFLGCRAKVVTIDPHTLAEVDESILRLGEVTGRRASSRALVSSIQQRTDSGGRTGSKLDHGRGWRCWSGPTHRSPPGIGSRRWSRWPGRSGDRRRWRGVSADLVGRR